MNKKIPILIGFFLLSFFIWLQLSHWTPIQYVITRLNYLAYDIQLRTKLLTQPHHFDSEVSIVDIDDKSIGAEGRWPWSRSKLANLIAKIQEAGAVVIALDITFSQPEKNIIDSVSKQLLKDNLLNAQFEKSLKQIYPYYDHDAELAQTLKKSDTITGITFLFRSETRGILPKPLTKLSDLGKQLGVIKFNGYYSNIPLIQDAAKSGGFLNVFADEDGIIRRVPVLARFQDLLYPSLALQAVRLYLLAEIQLDTEMYKDRLRIEGLQMGNHFIPTDSKAQVLIPFRGAIYSFRYYSATDVLNNNIARDAFAGKIIFVGTSATSTGDLKATSIQGLFPGVEIQATLADAILTDRFVYRPDWALGAEITLTALLGFFSVLVFPFLGPRMLSAIILVFPPLLIFGNNWLWSQTQFVLSVIIPILALVILALFNMIYGYLFETRKREYLKKMFGQYVPSKHIDAMLKSKSENYALKGEDREMTVLFADIRHFTTISEKLTATQLKEMLNAFLTPMTEVIFKHQGTIDKYVGDMIMAFWGAPLRDKRHSQHGLSAAIEMQKKLKMIRHDLAKKSGAEIHIGIGLNSGLMSIGDMGSQFRLNYTVLGDSVNLGSRVESLTKYYGVDIIATESTVYKQNHFAIKLLDRVRVKGKETGIMIYEVIDFIKDMSSEKKSEIKLSQLAINYYFKQDWNQSLILFKELHQQYPETYLYSMYLKRIATLLAHPPSADWDGVYSMKEK